MRVTVFVDAENVRRSVWPNIGRGELVQLVHAWAGERDVEAVVVFDGHAPAGGVASGAESADDWIAREANAAGGAYWLVTSDRELRERAGPRAERTIGGGAFARELRGRV